MAEWEFKMGGSHGASPLSIRGKTSAISYAAASVSSFFYKKKKSADLEAAASISSFFYKKKKNADTVALRRNLSSLFYCIVNSMPVGISFAIADKFLRKFVLSKKVRMPGFSPESSPPIWKPIGGEPSGGCCDDHLPPRV